MSTMRILGDCLLLGKAGDHACVATIIIPSTDPLSMADRLLTYKTGPYSKGNECFRSSFIYSIT